MQAAVKKHGIVAATVCRVQQMLKRVAEESLSISLCCKKRIWRELFQMQNPDKGFVRPSRGAGPAVRRLPGPVLPAMQRALLPCRAGLRFRSGRGAEPGAPAAVPRGWRSGREPWRAQQAAARTGQGRRAAVPERSKGSEVLFGLAPCALALWRARRALFRLFLKEERRGGPARPLRAELALQAAARGVPVLRVPGRALDALCRGRPHQGVCLEAAPLPLRSLRDAEEPQPGRAEGAGRPLLWLVLEHIQDPMNLGALLRSAYFLGVDRVVATRSNSCPLTPIVSKASAGAMEVFDVYSTDDLQGFLKAKSAEGWEVVGTVSRPEDVEDVPVISCSEFQWDKPLIVVIGSEGEGLSLGTQQQCQRMLAIPPGRALHPGLDSLNVSVAAGILLHSICSQKRRQGD
nr:rRNA methyltransferase 1, mitochondrial [Lonchura striata domestica]